MLKVPIAVAAATAAVGVLQRQLPSLPLMPLLLLLLLTATPPPPPRCYYDCHHRCPATATAIPTATVNATATAIPTPGTTPAPGSVVVK